MATECENHDELSPEEKRTRFYRGFWTYYSERYSNDGVRAGSGVPTSDYRVEGTGVKIRRIVSYVYVGVCLSRYDRTQSLEELTEPYIKNLAEKLGSSPECLIKFHGEAKNCNSLSQRCICTQDRQNWPQAVEWLHEQLEIYRTALGE